MHPLKAALAALILTACSSDAGGPVTTLTPTDLDASTAGDATDLGAAPDVEPTDADTTPDVVQPDTRTDTEPDAASGRDSEEAPEVVQPDTTPDSGPADQCTGPFDSDALIDRTALQVTTWECLVDCGRDVAPDEVQACTLGCVDRTTELTPGCSGCFAQLATCALDAGCFEVCSAEPDGWRCAYCQWTSCREGFEECAGEGVEMWRTEEACEGIERWGAIQIARTCFRIDAEGGAEGTPRDCIYDQVEGAYGDNDACVVCSADYGSDLLTECPMCIEAFEDRECVTCARTSAAFYAATFCGGTSPVTFELGE